MQVTLEGQPGKVGARVLAVGLSEPRVREQLRHRRSRLGARREGALHQMDRGCGAPNVPRRRIHPGRRRESQAGPPTPRRHRLKRKRGRTRTGREVGRETDRCRSVFHRPEQLRWRRVRGREREAASDHDE